MYVLHLRRKIRDFEIGDTAPPLFFALFSDISEAFVKKILHSEVRFHVRIVSLAIGSFSGFSCW